MTIALSTVCSTTLREPLIVSEFSQPGSCGSYTMALTLNYKGANFQCCVPTPDIPSARNTDLPPFHPPHLSPRVHLLTAAQLTIPLQLTTCLIL